MMRAFFLNSGQNYLNLIGRCETLKTRVKLDLNFTRPHAITYTNLHQNLIICPWAMSVSPTNFRIKTFDIF
jgi:hypothetical protein